MGDETVDVSNKEQLVICLRWVDDDLGVHEDFIGMHPLEGTSSDQIVRVIQVLVTFLLSLKNNVFIGYLP